MPTEGAPTSGRQTDAAPATASMRARRWAIAANYRAPADYDIPRLPDWTVYRDDDGALALGIGGEILLRAGDPVRVRR